MENQSFNLRRYAREVASGIGLPRFWRWWMAELAPVVPAASRSALKRWRMRPVIEFGEREAVFWRPEIVKGEIELAALAKAPLSGDPGDVAAVGRAAMASISADAHGQGAGRPPRIIVALPPRQVMRKKMVLPAAVEENLEQALSYDLDRHTPFRPDQLYFDAAIVARDPARKTITVDWAAALKTIVDGARRQAEAWGASVQAVVPGPASTLAPQLNFIPGGERPRGASLRRWQVWVPLVVVAAIALATVLVPLVQKREYAIALNKQAEEARVQALAADAVRTQLERLQGEYNYVLTKKYAYPSTVQLLDGVTRVLPDDTWVTQLEMRTSLHGKDTQRDLVLRGESANAGKLIGLLEDSKLVEQAALRSSTTKIQPGPGEIFDLGAQVKKLPPPAPVPLSAIPDAAPAALPLPAAPPPSAPTAAARPSAPPPGPRSAAPSGPAPASPTREVPAPPPPADQSRPASQPPAAPAPPAAAPAGDDEEAE
jgi:general secretion pathway protein L